MSETDQRPESAQLGASDDRLRAIIETVPVVTFVDVWEPEAGGWIQIYVSPQVLALTGMTGEAFQNITWRQHIHPDDLPRVEAAFDPARHDGQRLTVEYRFRKPSGEWRWFRQESVVIGEGPGQLTQGVILDVTEQRNAEQALAESEARLRTLMESAPIATFAGEWDPELSAWRHTYFSPQIEGLTGFSVAELMRGTTWSERIHPDDLAGYLERSRSPEMPKDHWLGLYRFLRKDGEWRWFQIHTRTIEKDGAQTVQGVILDVTDQRLAQEALERSELHYRMLVEQLPQTVTYVREEDPETGQLKTTYISPQIEHLFGVSAEEWLATDKHILDFVHPDDRDEVEARARTVLEREADFDHEYRIVLPSGEVRWIRNIARGVPGQSATGGQLRRWHGLMIDITAQREATAALQESRQQYRTLVEQLPNVVTFVVESGPDGKDGRTTYVSPQIQSMLGYSPEEWKRFKPGWIDLIHLNDHATARTEWSRLWSKHHDADFEVRIARKDGTMRWVHVLCRYLPGHDAEGQPVHRWHGVMVDVTTPRLAEARMRQQDTRFRALIQNSSEIITILTETGVATYQSPSVLRDLGVPPDELVGENVFERMHPDDVERVLRVFRDLLEKPGATSEPVQFRMLHQNGEWRWLESIASNHLHQPDLGGIVVISRDITERKEAEQRFFQEHAQLQALLDNSATLIYFKDTERRYVRANAAVAQYLNLSSPEDLIGLRDEDLVPEDSARITAADDEHVLTTGEPVIDRPELVRYHAGQERWFLTTKIPIRNERGEIIGLVGTSRDISELHQAQEIIQRSEERFRLLVQNAADMVAIIRLEGEQVAIQYISPAIESQLGYTPDEMEGSVQELKAFTPDAEQLYETLRSLSEQPGGRQLIQARMYHRDGTIRWLEMMVSNHLETEGIEGLVINARDITERKEAEERLRASEDRFRALFRHAPDVVLVLDPDRRVLFASPSIERAIGVPAEEVVASGEPLTVHPDDYAAMMARFDEAIEQPGVAIPCEARVRHADGTWRWWECTITNLLGTSAVGGLVVNARDVTERKAAEAALRSREARFRSLVQHASDLTAIMEPDGTITYVTPSIERLLGYSPQAFQALPALSWIESEDRHRFQTHISDIVQTSEWRGPIELTCVHADSSTRQLEVVTTPLLHDPNIRGIVINARDVTERRSLENQLAHQAFHDPLTGLPNRTLFNDRLNHTHARARRTGLAYAVLFLDLDDFKVINDTLGHQAGDRLLQAIAMRLQATARQGDTVARLGGDEFILLLEDIRGVDEAKEVARRIIERLQDPLTVNDHEVLVVPSIGIAIGNPNQESPQDLLRDADVAMYEAKSRGKAQAVVFDPGMNTQAWARLQLQAELRHAISRQQLRVFYQPQIELATGAIVEVEALVRWDHPTRGLIAPNDFIPVAEETGLIVALGRWVLNEACNQAQRWNDLRRGLGAPPLVLSVNLSARQFLQPSLVNDVKGILQRTGLAPSLLRLEITESVALRDLETTMATMHGLRALGVRLAIDDFGTGYSGLSYLRYCPVDTIKIDRSYVSGLGQDPSDTAMIHAVMAFADTLELDVCAEGIERLDQLEQLRAIGCERGQGFYFSPPIPPDLITTMLAQNPRWGRLPRLPAGVAAPKSAT